MPGSKSGGVSAESAPVWENPLIPHKKLRELYTAMVELQFLEEHVATLRRPKKQSERRHTVAGEEACRVSTALSLSAGDMTSEVANGVATSFVRGAKLTELKATTGQLPITKDPTARLHMAIGAALALTAKKKGALVLAYVYPGDLSLAAWKPILRLAGANNAPIIFVALPERNSAKKHGQLSLASTPCGVPGIPVDAADAVALYRVAQESMLRARAGGGPVLMECVPFLLPGKKPAPADPILNLRDSLLRRKLVDDRWLESIPDRFATRLRAASL